MDNMKVHVTGIILVKSTKTIKDALTSFADNELGKEKGLERQVSTGIDSPQRGGNFVHHSSIMVAEKKNYKK